jgi:HEAT repeat protein
MIYHETLLSLQQYEVAATDQLLAAGPDMRSLDREIAADALGRRGPHLVADPL